MSRAEQARYSESRYGQAPASGHAAGGRHASHAAPASGAPGARHGHVRTSQPAAAPAQPRTRRATPRGSATDGRAHYAGPSHGAQAPLTGATPAQSFNTYSPTGAQATSRAAGVEAYSARRKKKGRGHILRGCLVVLLLLVIGGGAAAWAFISHIDNQLGKDVSEELRQQLQDVSVEPQDPFYMLILGVDKSDERAEEWGSSTANFRADTIILARVDPKAQNVSLVSIPRDTYADLGNGSMDKINGAYSLGGPAQMVKAVEKLAGVDISHYAEIDFEQFTSIVDTIGGIEVTLPVDVIEHEYIDVELYAGTQTLNGEQALLLCRTRHAYDKYGVGGDFYRAANQRMVIWAILKKILAQDVATMTGTISQLAGSVTTDFKVVDLLSLGMQFKDLDTDNSIYSGQLPTKSVYTNNLWYEYVDETGWQTMMDRVKQGLPPYETEDQDFTRELAGTVGNGVTGDGGSEGSGDGSDTPTYSGTVQVLNGTGRAGLAASEAQTLKTAGFDAVAENADSDSVQTSAVIYNGSKRSAALGVAESLGIDSSLVTENSGSYSTKYDVVVILGSDRLM